MCQTHYSVSRKLTDLQSTLISSYMQFLIFLASRIFPNFYSYTRTRSWILLASHHRKWGNVQKYRAKLILLRYRRTISPKIRRFPYKREWWKNNTPLWSEEELQVFPWELAVLYSLSTKEMNLLLEFMRFQNSIWTSSWSRSTKCHALQGLRTHFLNLASQEPCVYFHWNVKGDITLSHFHIFPLQIRDYGYSLYYFRSVEELCLRDTGFESAILTVLWKNRDLHSWPNIKASPIHGPINFLGCPFRIKLQDEADNARTEFIWKFLRLILWPYRKFQRWIAKIRKDNPLKVELKIGCKGWVFKFKL